MTITEYKSFNAKKKNNILFIITSIISCQVSAVMLFIRLLSGKAEYKRLPSVWSMIFFIIWSLITAFIAIGISMDYNAAKEKSDQPIKYMMAEQEGLKVSELLIMYGFLCLPLGLNPAAALVYNRRCDRLKKEAETFTTLITEVKTSILESDSDIPYLVRTFNIKKNEIVDIVQYLISSSALPGFSYSVHEGKLIREQQGKNKTEVTWVCPACAANNKSLVYPGEKPQCKYCGNFQTD